MKHPRTAAGDASRQRWEAQIAALSQPQTPSGVARTPITVGRIVDESLAIIAAEGFDALTMRRVAAALDTGPSSLYAHVRNKAELDDLLLARLCSQVSLPAPDGACWRAQFLDVCRQLRDQFLRYPGISRVALASVPDGLETLRVMEGMLALLLMGGVATQPAAWAIDAALLYVSSYSYEASLRQPGAGRADGRVFDRAETIRRLEMLPTDRFPHTTALARELTAGAGHERFDFTVELLLGGLTAASVPDRRDP
ncbi:MAG: TetR/AcrR family transcriptional regulator [Candidatus Nanopelagicales bacterium]